MSWNNRQVRYYDSDFGTPIQPIPNGGLIYYQTSNNIQPVNSSEQWRFYQQPVLVREMQPNQHNFAPAYPHHPFNSNMPVLGPNTQSVSVRINDYTGPSNSPNENRTWTQVSSRQVELEYKPYSSSRTHHRSNQPSYSSTDHHRSYSRRDENNSKMARSEKRRSYESSRSSHSRDRHRSRSRERSQVRHSASHDHYRSDKACQAGNRMSPKWSTRPIADVKPVIKQQSFADNPDYLSNAGSTSSTSTTLHVRSDCLSNAGSTSSTSTHKQMTNIRPTMSSIRPPRIPMPKQKILGKTRPLADSTPSIRDIFTPVRANTTPANVAVPVNSEQSAEKSQESNEPTCPDVVPTLNEASTERVSLSSVESINQEEEDGNECFNSPNDSVPTSNTDPQESPSNVVEVKSPSKPVSYKSPTNALEICIDCKDKSKTVYLRNRCNKCYNRFNTINRRNDVEKAEARVLRDCLKAGNTTRTRKPPVRFVNEYLNTEAPPEKKKPNAEKNSKKAASTDRLKHLDEEARKFIVKELPVVSDALEDTLKRSIKPELLSDHDDTASTPKKTMEKSETSAFICSDCGKRERHKAKRRCGSCYAAYRKKLAKKSTSSAKKNPEPEIIVERSRPLRSNSTPTNLPLDTNKRRCIDCNGNIGSNNRFHQSKIRCYPCTKALQNWKCNSCHQPKKYYKSDRCEECFEKYGYSKGPEKSNKPSTSSEPVKQSTSEKTTEPEYIDVSSGSEDEWLY